jgi:hypothetical protein
MQFPGTALPENNISEAEKSSCMAGSKKFSEAAHQQET